MNRIHNEKAYYLLIVPLHINSKNILKMIVLTQINGQPIWVNENKIDYLLPSNKGATIYFNENYFIDVRNAVEVIYRMIENKE